MYFTFSHSRNTESLYLKFNSLIGLEFLSHSEVIHANVNDEHIWRWKWLLLSVNVLTFRGEKNPNTKDGRISWIHFPLEHILSLFLHPESVEWQECEWEWDPLFPMMVIEESQTRHIYHCLSVVPGIPIRKSGENGHVPWKVAINSRSGIGRHQPHFWIESNIIQSG